jgi:hypothetical protein
MRLLVWQARRRALGNIQFIGQLYKQKMLTEKIMHSCITTLLGEVRRVFLHPSPLHIVVLWTGQVAHTFAEI